MDSKLYFRDEDGKPMILLFYVDDLFMIGDEKFIVETKKKLVVELEMKDLDMMHYFVGVEVW